MNRPLASLLASGLLAGAMLCPVTGAGAESGSVGIARSEQATASTRPHPRTKSLMKRTWGIEVVFVRQASAGYMLEFRYKVLDPAKAAPLFERKTKPVLVHEETGARLIVPTPAKTGALRNSNTPIQGRTYWMFFANPGKLVDPGDVVRIEIGKFLADKLVVE